eukprot:CAMPEP_0195101082 /NCGR_PEP_ID=MMETSP0448-20130528/64901_1 /TAXON_ID=66468 /ORGANISM="Heterocapsa triquestra, Strain CCMP 448" /LENGTH=56 /DNA_ID=CAMNT_0040136333 /DNA_START=106 /DNA_END=273 /DNA_ORIENTATION=-
MYKPPEVRKTMMSLALGWRDSETQWTRSSGLMNAKVHRHSSGSEVTSAMKLAKALY